MVPLGTCVRVSCGVFRDLCEDVVRLAEDPAGVGLGCHQQLQGADVDIGAQGPEVRLLQVVDPLQLLHLKATQEVEWVGPEVGRVSGAGLTLW